jgi:hypothetical protein
VCVRMCKGGSFLFTGGILLVHGSPASRFEVEDEKDPKKIHTIQAFRAQHSHHRLPW